MLEGMWSRGVIEAARVLTVPVFIRIVVAATSGEAAEETGIIVAGEVGPGPCLGSCGPLKDIMS